MKKILIMILFIASFLSAGWKRVMGSSDAPLPPEKNVIRSDSLGVFIRTAVFGFIEEDTTVDNKDFKRIKIPEEPIDQDTMRAGKPQIPFIRLLIAVPDSCDFNITVYESDYTLFEDYLIYPIPRIVFEDSGGCICYKEVYTYDTSFYQKDTLYPDKFYEVNSDGYWRDQRMLEVFLYPVQFNPQQKLMYFYNGLDLRIEYSGEVFENENGLGPFEDIGREILLNYPGIDWEPESVPEPSVHYYTKLDTNNVADYVIVTPEDFIDEEIALANIEQFAQWRVTHNQFDVGIVAMEDVYEEFLNPPYEDSAKALRDFLIYAYNNWYASSMPDNHFAYCLFIGDWDYVPTKLVLEGEWLCAYEGYFRNLNGGWGEEIMLGRWPVKQTNVQDLVTIAQKTINYEKYPVQVDSFRRRGFLIAGDGEGMWWFDQVVTSSKSYFTDINYDTLVTRYSQIQNDSVFRVAIHNNLNAGEIITLYVDHGAPEGWWAHYDTLWVKQLHNGDSLPVVLSDACFTAMFQWDHPFYKSHHSYPAGISLGEHFLINPEGGAVAFYGATAPAGGLLSTVLKQILRYQNWILGKSLVNLSAVYCLLGDPALDLGDYTTFPDLPDLVIRPQGIDISLLSPYPYPAGGDEIPIQAEVWNIGGAAAYDVDVKFELICEEVLIYDTTVTIDTIQPRESAIAIVYWNTGYTHPDFYGEIGDCEFWVKADPNGEIEESWPYNNTSLITKKVAIYPNQPGWPKKVTGFSQPAIANIDGTGSVEIVYTSLDSVYVFDKDGDVFTGWPKYFRDVYSIVLGDIDSNDTTDIIAVSPDSLKVYDYQGNVMSDWPIKIPHNNMAFRGYPALGHVSGNQYLNVVLFATPTSTQQFDCLRVLVYRYDGLLLYDFGISTLPGIYSSNGPSISDVKAGAIDEIVISYESTAEKSGVKTCVFDSSGLVDSHAYGSSNVTSALVDINNDNYADIIIGSRDGKIRAYDVENDVLLWERETEGAINSSPAVGDIHPLEEGVEVTFGNDASEIHLREEDDGDNIDPWWYTIEPSTTVRTSPAIADINGDQNLDIIIGANNGYVYAFKHTKDSIPPFPLPLFGKTSSPVIGDIDGDRKSEIILSTSDGYLHVWENRDSRVTSYSLEWPQFHHDYQRTGLYGW